MDAVPEDVMKLAETLRDRVFNAMHDDDGRLTDSDPAEMIARALMDERMAERERCAKIAEADAAVLNDTATRLGAFDRGGDSSMRHLLSLHEQGALIAEIIATAIRNPTP